MIINHVHLISRSAISGAGSMRAKPRRRLQLEKIIRQGTSKRSRHMDTPQEHSQRSVP